MAIEDETEEMVGEDAKSSRSVLSALNKADTEFREWRTVCHTIDGIYGKEGSYGGLRKSLDEYGWQDSKLDLFWSSYEVLKPAVYAKSPVPAITPIFKDNKRLENTTAELLERVSTVTLAANDIDCVMKQVRDDLIFDGRGVMWLRYESGDGQKVCIEHLDRMDFCHEPARYWSEVGWVARRAWMTRKEMRKRFRKHSGDAYQSAKFELRRDDESHDKQALARKAGVWEVWHKADNRVYWATEGVDVLLDSSEPFLSLRGFFPCPKPAYATLRRRSLVPVPDWERYALHFHKISTLTGRIYLLLDQVKMKGLIPAGGEIADAMAQLIASDDDSLVIGVPGAAMLSGGTGNFVQWMPIKEIAEAIQGLILARQQLIEDFYQLSGISDIMRGATEEQETLGAQRLKSQYGSVRVRGKIDELQRIAAEAVKIMAEIIAEKFNQKSLLDISQMDLLTSAEIKKRIKEVEDAAESEMKALEKKVKEASQQQQAADPAQAQQQLEQAQQQIIQKYGAMLEEVENLVPIDDVVELLRDERVRNFTFEVETDSTILTDEVAEKASRSEALAAFTNSAQALMGLMAMGEEGAQLAGEFIKFQMAPYRLGRQMETAIDSFIEAAPKLAASMQGGEDGGLAEAQRELAAAEMEKAKAATLKVEADHAAKTAEMQRKMAEMQQRAFEAEQKSTLEQGRLELQLADLQGKLDKQTADMDKVRAETLEILNNIGLANQQQAIDEFESVADVEMRQNDQAMTAQQSQQDAAFRAEEGQRADRQQQFTERQGERAEGRADRQQSFAEQQARTERTDNG